MIFIAAPFSLSYYEHAMSTQPKGRDMSEQTHRNDQGKQTPTQKTFKPRRRKK